LGCPILSSRHISEICGLEQQSQFALIARENTRAAASANDGTWRAMAMLIRVLKDRSRQCVHRARRDQVTRAQLEAHRSAAPLAAPFLGAVSVFDLDCSSTVLTKQREVRST
jgi:hypothetical protein